MMGEYVVVGPYYMFQLRNLPETKLSASAALVDSVLGKYNGVDINLKDNLSGDVVRGPFTRMIREYIYYCLKVSILSDTYTAEMIPSLLDELNLSLSQSFDQKPGGE